MNSEAIAVLESLGPICEYRCSPEQAEQAVERMQGAIESLRRGLKAKPSEREQFLYALEVIAAMVSLMSSRASVCELQHEALACENVDLRWATTKWIEFVRDHLGSADEGGADRGDP